jgi:pimeloyl-ACP methyl ester carboxylesterase
MAFAVHRAEVRDGLELAYVRAGEGGYPLLLVHGWPETKRIWWRNVQPLADAGFEVIAPDLRGFGDSGLAPDDRYDAAAHARDMEALTRGVLGHECVTAVAGDLGGVVAQDLSLRFEGFVERLVLFNTIPPLLPDSPPQVPRVTRMAADYFLRQSRDADGLAAERDDVDFMTEPFADAERFRASIANYEYAGGPRKAPEPLRMTEQNPTPTLILYGPEDHVIPHDFPQRMELAFPDRCGPFVVEGAGHFLQWERADVLNGAIRWLCSDLLRQSAG